MMQAFSLHEIGNFMNMAVSLEFYAEANITNTPCPISIRKNQLDNEYLNIKLFKVLKTTNIFM